MGSIALCNDINYFCIILGCFSFFNIMYSKGTIFCTMNLQKIHDILLFISVGVYCI